MESLGSSSRKLRRLAESIEKRLAQIPEANVAVVIGGLTRDGRQHAVRHAWHVIGPDARLNDALQRAMPGLQLTARLYEELDTDLRDLCTMPGNAEQRAKKTRVLLAREWQEQNRGTVYERNKQIYDTIRKYPETKFPWWDDVTGGVECTNTAVNDPEISEKVFRYLAQKRIMEHTM